MSTIIKKIMNYRILHICCLLFLFIKASTSLDMIAPDQVIQDGDTLVSAGGTFELGFFRPGNSNCRYLGIWYKLSPSIVVWVANRDNPINDTTGVLVVNNQGVLVLNNGTNNTFWLSIISKEAENPFAQLLDSGNLVVKNGNGSNTDHFLWQSFDYPCDTLLPGMILGWDLATGLDRSISSWKSTEDPSQGEYIIKLDRRGYPQAFLMKDSVMKARAGSWNGFFFTGFGFNMPDPVTTGEFVLNERETYYEYELLNRSVLSRYIVTPSGVGQRFDWTSDTNWQIVSTGPVDRCDNYALCGAYSICNSSSTPICACLRGYAPKNPKEWNMSYWSNGCVRSIPIDCNGNGGFMKYNGIKLPDTSASWYSKTMGLEECRKSCLQNCSCTAYSSLDIRDGGSGCILWFNELLDMRQFFEGGQDIYVQVSASELGDLENYNNGNTIKKPIGIAVGSTTLIVVILVFGLTIFIRKKKLRMSGMAKLFYPGQFNHKPRKEDLDLPTFEFPVIAKATDNFSGTKKLGEGGFGSVYKGILTDGQELAVKRLSKNSCQGLEEFKNEVALIAKLQHRNLVKLLGYCIHAEEKMLIYEYMPNKSLDYFIFDENKSKSLDWCNRFHIIGGIARGLVYLHQDSRLRIIHRDLKTSNILLDENMNPKISDFGLARTFWGDQVEANTNKVAGTYGYMPPEYVVHGHFSMKSDVFSFGVIILEIVSGKKNRGFSDPEHYLNLLGHAWRLWTEGRLLEIMDAFLGERCTSSEVIRCIHVGLLCVQERPEDRPDMSAVILMLNGEKLLPHPKVPGFYTGRDISKAGFLSERFIYSKNDITLSDLEAR